MTYKTGSIGDFMRWTKQVVTDRVALNAGLIARKPATKSLGTSASPEAMVKLLSAENLVLLTHHRDGAARLLPMKRDPRYSHEEI
jgi:hypothetical protein